MLSDKFIIYTGMARTCVRPLEKILVREYSVSQMSIEKILYDKLQKYDPALSIPIKHPGACAARARVLKE